MAPKQNYHYKMAGVELDRCATAHEMSNQQPVKARSSPTQTWIAEGKRKTGPDLQLCSFTFFALHDLYPGSCPNIVILTQPLWL